MNNVIDINDIQTYPDEIIQSFNLDVADIDCDKLFENYSFKCCHVCCTSNIENYKKYGIMRPFCFNIDGVSTINHTLRNIILNHLIDKPNYGDYVKKYNDLLIETYNKAKNLINNWNGKYSCIWYTMDNLNKIFLNDSAYRPILHYYGGELFRNICISDELAEQIGNNSKSYVIFFKLCYNDLKCGNIYILAVYDYMKKTYNGEKTEHGFENYVNKDIPPSDIIEICEVKKYD